MPRHLRVLVEVMTPEEDGGAMSSDVTVAESLLLPEAELFSKEELMKAEPRTILEGFTDAEEAFGRDPRIGVDAEEWLVEVDLIVE